MTPRPTTEQLDELGQLRGELDEEAVEQEAANVGDGSYTADLLRRAAATLFALETRRDVAEAHIKAAQKFADEGDGSWPFVEALSLIAHVSELEKALTDCERTTWHEGVTPPRVAVRVRRIVQKALGAPPLEGG